MNALNRLGVGVAVLCSAALLLSGCGGGGSGRSASRLYHCLGMSASVRSNRVRMVSECPESSGAEVGPWVAACHAISVESFQKRRRAAARLHAFIVDKLARNRGLRVTF